MTLDELKALIAANKQSMQLLDKRMKTLNDLVEHDDFNYWEDGRYPYFYGVVGIDGQEGILIGNGEDGPAPASRIAGQVLEQNDNTIWNGHIELQSDAPFVVTDIHACVRKDVGDISSIAGYGGAAGDFSFRGTMGAGPQDFNFISEMPDFSLGFIDRASGRILFQANQVDRGVNGTLDKLLTSSLFNTVRLFRPSPARGLGAMGHGPDSGFELPAECMLPANGVIEVQTRATFWQNVTPNLANFNGPFRVYVTLLGYKIFGE